MKGDLRWKSSRARRQLRKDGSKIKEQGRRGVKEERQSAI